MGLRSAGLAARAIRHSPRSAGHVTTSASRLRRLFFLILGFQASAGVWLNVVLGLPENLKWIDEALIALLSVPMLLKLIFGRFQTPPRPAMFSLIIAYMLIGVFSGLVNDVPPNEMVIGLRSLAQFYLFYLILLWLDVDRGDVETFFAAFLLTSTLQLIPALQQFLAAQNGLGYDDVTAGFGAGTANLLGYYCTLVILVCGSLTIVGRQTKYLLFTTPVGIVWALATALGSILMFVFSALLALVLSPQFRKLKLIVPATALFAVAVFAINEFEVRQHNTTIVDLVSGTLGGLNRYEIDDFGNPGRLALLSSALTLISEDFTTLLLGVGTGSVGTILNEGQLPSHFERLSNLSGARFVPSSLVQFMSEIGVLGLAVTLGIYLLIFFAAVRARKRATDPFDQAMMLALILFVPFLVGASLGETVWTFQAIVYPFWVLAAYAETIIRRQQPATRKGKLARQHPSLSR